MSESSPRFPALQRVREYLEGLSSRERTLLSTLGAVIMLLAVLGVGRLVARASTRPGSGGVACQRPCYPSGRWTAGRGAHR